MDIFVVAHLLYFSAETHESFSKDIRLPKVDCPAEVDDGATRLAMARWFRLSVKAPKHWYDQAPISRSHRYVNIPLKHLGAASCVSEKVIALCHDQTVPLTMKQFLQDNCAVASKPKVTFTGPNGSSTVDYAWVEATSMAHAHEAILNYQVIIHQLFPWVTTGFIIQRVLLKFNWMAAYSHMPTRIGIVRSFFDGVLRINASRACKKSLPMDYKEQLEFMNTIIEKTPNLAPSAAAGAPAAAEGYRIPRAAAAKGASAARSGASSSNSAKDKRPRFNNLLLCFDFNSTKGIDCTRPTTPLGCREAKGQEYAHRCSAKTAAGTYCLMAHRRKEH